MFRVKQLRGHESYLVEGNGTSDELRAAIPKCAEFVRLLICGHSNIFDDGMARSLSETAGISIFCGEGIDLSALKELKRPKSIFLSGRYIGHFSFGVFKSIESLGFYKDVGINDIDRLELLRNLAVYDVGGELGTYIDRVQYKLASLDVSACVLKAPNNKNAVDKMTAIRVRGGVVSRCFFDCISTDCLDTVYLQGVDLNGVIEPLSNAINLRVLIMDDCGRIDNLEFLTGSKIEYLIIQGNTKVNDYSHVSEIETLIEFFSESIESRNVHLSKIKQNIKSRISSVIPAPSDVWSLAVFS
jgi:hypothetical protein